MKHFIGAALAVILLAPLAAHAQQGRQATGDQTSFRQGVRALPYTQKRGQISRSELSTKTNRGRHSTMGAAPMR